MRTCSCVLALAVVGCTSASIESSWRAPSAPELTSVVAMSPGPEGYRRRAVEDQLAAQLSRHGVRAVPAYSVLSGRDLVDRDRAIAALRARGFDGIVAMRLVDARQQPDYSPGFDAYWVGAWGTVAPGTIVRVEISAYSLATRQLVWSALSKSTDPESANEIIGDVTKLAGDRLAQERIVGAPQAAAR